jgi:hypothetical protein
MELEEGGDVVQSGKGPDLRAAVADAIAKFEAWRKAEPSGTKPAAAAPHRLTAPGAAERERLEEQERQRRERDAS